MNGGQYQHMSVFRTHPSLRWAVPVAAAAAVVGGSVASGVVSASADAGLAPRSAAQLLTDVATARLDGLSGTVVQRADLGLPSLPGVSSGAGGQGSSEFSAMVSGTHTMRLWYAGPAQTRVALMGTLGESDIIHNGRDVWIWSSSKNTAQHMTLPQESAGTQAPGRLPSATDVPKTPQEAADAALAALDPTTIVRTSGTAKVAGRSAYELVLSPRTTQSLVAQVRIAIDATKRVPLRVQVYAKGATDPAFEVAFSQVDFARPDAAQFRFNPPPGAKVTQRAASSGKPGRAQSDPVQSDPPLSDPVRPHTAATRPTVVGTGWASVVMAQLPQGSAASSSGAAGSTSRRGSSGSGDQMLQRMLASLPAVSGAWGSGHLLAGKLFSVLLTDDGRVVAGAVTPAALYAAAGR